jgi:pimeloyl-ACP methyl ester carboxylesterase
VSPVMARMTLNKTVKAMFAPQPVPPDFLPKLSREMLVRPSQLRADAQDGALMIPAAVALRKRYAEVDVPVAIFAGDADRVVDFDAHTRKLHGELRNSELHVVPGAGHMAHYAAPDKIVAAVSG